jgi:putative transposase
MLTNLKKYDEYKWLCSADSTSLQNSIRDLDMAFKRFFKKLSKYPKFKSTNCCYLTYRSQCVNGNICVIGNKIKLPKIGEVKAKISRQVEGSIIYATITHTTSGKYFVSLCVNCDIDVLKNNGKQIGLDMGISKFYTDSNGDSVVNPKIYQKYKKKLAREHKKFSSTMPRSANRKKVRVRLAKIYERMANIRKDFQHKISINLVRENKIIAIETLKIQNMVKNHTLASSIYDSAWRQFFEQLRYKAKVYGTEIIQVDNFYPSSQICSLCGFKNIKTKSLWIREWTCPNCGVHHNRDVNAAVNILKKALEQNRTA